MIPETCSGARGVLGSSPSVCLLTEGMRPPLRDGARSLLTRSEPAFGPIKGGLARETFRVWGRSSSAVYLGIL